MNTRKALLHRMEHLYDEIEFLHHEMKNDFSARYGTQVWAEFTWGTPVSAPQARRLLLPQGARELQQIHTVRIGSITTNPGDIVIWTAWPKKQKLNQMLVLNAELVKLWQEFDINHT